MITELKEISMNTREHVVKGRKWYVHDIKVSFLFNEKPLKALFTIEEPWKHNDGNLVETRVLSYAIYQNGHNIHEGNSHGATSFRKDPIDLIQYYLTDVHDCVIGISKNSK